MAQDLGQRLCWDVARRDESRATRSLYRKPLVNGVYRLDNGAWLEDFFRFLPELAGLNLLHHVMGEVVQRKMVPFGTPQYWRQHNRPAFRPSPINAVVVCKWHGRNYGLWGIIAFLTNASVLNRL